MREIPLNSRKHPGLVTLVDDEDYRAAAEYKWSPSGRGPGKFRAHSLINGSHVYLHNFICELHGLPTSPDHANRDPLDNQKANFRFAPTGTQQQGNKDLQCNNTSGYKGVSRKRSTGRWLASIAVHGKSKHLGYHDSPEAAARAYDKAAVEYFGEFAYLNFPDEMTVTHVAV